MEVTTNLCTAKDRSHSMNERLGSPHNNSSSRSLSGLPKLLRLTHMVYSSNLTVLQVRMGFYQDAGCIFQRKEYKEIVHNILKILMIRIYELTQKTPCCCAEGVHIS